MYTFDWLTLETSVGLRCYPSSYMHLRTWHLQPPRQPEQRRKPAVETGLSNPVSWAIWGDKAESESWSDVIRSGSGDIESKIEKQCG